MKTAAILGAGSMLAQEITVQLRALDIEIVSIGRSQPNDIAFDLTNPFQEEDAKGQKADVLFHCASAFSGDDLAGITENFRTNSVGSLQVLNLASALDCCHIVFAGSLSSEPHYELPGPISSYGLSKAHGEQVLEWGIQRLSGYFCSLRLPQLYDVEGRCCAHQRWFGRIIGYAARGLDLSLPPATSARNFMHVEDAARSMIVAAHKQICGTWIVGHTEQLDYKSIARLAYNEFDCGGTVTVDSSKTPFKPVASISDFGIFEHLGIQPSISMSEGIALIKKSGMGLKFGPIDVL